MDEQTQKMILVLAQVYMQQTGEQDPQKAMLAIVQVVQAAQQGDKQAESMLQQLVQIAQGGLEESAPQMARHGAKLAYINMLRGNCPEGQEMMSFKVGGKVCKKCVAKKQSGSTLDTSKKQLNTNQNKQTTNKVNSNKTSNLPKKTPVKSDTKKDTNDTPYGTAAWNRRLDDNRRKFENDPKNAKYKGEPLDRCGGKVKKHQIGGFLDNVKNAASDAWNWASGPVDKAAKEAAQAGGRTAKKAWRWVHDNPGVSNAISIGTGLLPVKEGFHAVGHGLNWDDYDIPANTGRVTQIDDRGNWAQQPSEPYTPLPGLPGGGPARVGKWVKPWRKPTVTPAPVQQVTPVVVETPVAETPIVETPVATPVIDNTTPVEKADTTVKETTPSKRKVKFNAKRAKGVEITDNGVKFKRGKRVSYESE